MKVKLYVPLVFNVPLLNTPVVLLTSCAIGSLFVHVTEVLTATVNVAGLNAEPEIDTAFPLPGPGLGAGLEEYPLEAFEQLTTKTSTNILTGIKI